MIAVSCVAGVPLTIEKRKCFAWKDVGWLVEGWAYSLLFSAARLLAPHGDEGLDLFKFMKAARVFLIMLKP